jgi:hypothetical protein
VCGRLVPISRRRPVYNRYWTEIQTKSDVLGAVLWQLVRDDVDCALLSRLDIPREIGFRLTRLHGEIDLQQMRRPGATDQAKVTAGPATMLIGAVSLRATKHVERTIAAATPINISSAATKTNAVRAMRRGECPNAPRRLFPAVGSDLALSGMSSGVASLDSVASTNATLSASPTRSVATARAANTPPRTSRVRALHSTRSDQASPGAW